MPASPATIPAEPLELLKKHFGFDAFRPGQETVIDSLLAGHSALAVFPTGSGKSLCYQLPALLLPGLTVVVSPLIALMKDQIDFLTRRGIKAARLDSTLTLDQSRNVEAGMQNGTLKLLYVSPERFNNERFLGLLGRTHISLFAVDEAHCISEWGHNFRPDYLKLADTARRLGVERALALTATAAPNVQADICRAFDIQAQDATVTGFYRPNLRLATTPVTSARRDEMLLARLAKRPPGPAIVYVTLQKTAEKVAAKLTDAGLRAWAYHAGMDPEPRAQVQDDWMASDAGICVATIAFGMGIDKADVRYVYHYNLPKSLESYSQEIGRAGRDGKPSTVELLACPDDVPTLENFAYGDTPAASALGSLIDDLLSRGPAFDISLYEVSQKHDLRPLVLKTALTYLELAQFITQGTPRYAGYEFKPLGDHTRQSIAEAFTGNAQTLVKNLFAQSKQGRIWYSLNPDDLAATLELERSRIVRALEVMEERGYIELRASDARQVYTRTDKPADADRLIADLVEKFAKRETGEMNRLQQVLDLVTLNGCQVNALAAHFGEVRPDSCGHCTFCVTGRAQKLPPPAPLPPPSAETLAEIASLRHANPAALGDARQAARFLCGLSSPALTRAKLTKHSLWAAWEDRPFADVLTLMEDG